MSLTFAFGNFYTLAPAESTFSKNVIVLRIILGSGPKKHTQNFSMFLNYWLEIQKNLSLNGAKKLFYFASSKTLKKFSGTNLLGTFG